MTQGATLKLVLARRLAANASLALLLSLAFAGVSAENQPQPASASAPSACPVGWTFTERPAGNTEIPYPVYCEKTYTYSATTYLATLPERVEELHFDLYGAPGGIGGWDAGVVGGQSGPVGRVTGTQVVTPGTSVQVSVGGKGANGYASGADPTSGPAGGYSSLGFSGGGGGPRGCSFNACGSDRGGSGTGGAGGAATLISFSAQILVAGGAGGGGGANCYGCANPNGDIVGNGRNGQTAASYRPVGYPAGGVGAGNNGSAYRFNASAGGGGGGVRGGTGGAASLDGGNAGLNSTGASLTSSYVAASSIPRPAGDTSTGGIAILRFIAVPVVASITTNPAGISNSNSRIFTVTFSEPVSGFGLEDLELGGTSGSEDGWTLSFVDSGDSKTYVVIAVHANAPSGTIELSVDATGVVADERQGVGTLTSTAVTIDRTPPAVSSSVFLPTANPGQFEVVITFSEPISSSATIDWSAFTFTGTSLNWSTLSPVVSGNTLTFVVSSSSLVDDTTLEYSIGLGFVQDYYGNELVAAYQDDVLIDLDAVAATFSNEPTRFSNSATLDLNFDAYVHGLTAADFSIVGDSVGCDITGVTGSGSSYQVTVGTCTASTSGTIQVALAGNAALSLLGAPSPENQVLSSTFVYDNINPVAGVVSKTVSGTRATYVISFSETVLGFNTNSISVSHSVAGGASGWSISNLVYLGNNEYSFDVENDAALDGNLSLAVLTAGVTDLAGNALVSTAVQAASTLALSNPPTLNLGEAAVIGTSAKAVLPEFDLVSRGASIKGIRVFLENGNSGDILALPGNNAIFGSNYSSNFSSDTGILEITTTQNKSEAQWEAAIRSVTLTANGSSTASRTVGVHLKPTDKYSYTTQHFYERAALPPPPKTTDWVVFQGYASAKSKYGSPGYLAHLSTTAELADSVTMGILRYDVVGMFGVDRSSPSGYVWAGGPAAENGQYATVDGIRPETIGSGFWGPGEPQNFVGEQYGAYYGTPGKFYNAALGDNYTTGFFVEYGDQVIGDSNWDFIETASVAIDVSAPFITRVYATDGDYKRGEEVELNVLFSEAVVVSGTSTTESKLEIMPGVFAEYVSGSGTSVLKYRYVVGAGVTTSDLSYVATNSLTAGSRAFKDMVGNTADLTLPAPGASGSLISQSNVELSGDVLDIEMNTPVTQSSQASIQYVITSPVTMSCNSLAATDFTYQNLNSASFQVSPAGNSTSCTITLPHTIAKGSFANAVISLSQTFEITTDGSVTYSSITLGGNTVLVTNPADPGKGEVILDEANLSRTRPGTLIRNDAVGVLPGATAEAKAALKARNILAPPAGATLPELEIRGDFRQLSNMSEAVAARKQKVIRAGDVIRAKMQISASHAAAYKVLSYIDVNSGFLFTGEQDFDVNGEVSTEPLVFTEPGEYYVRMYVVAKTKVAGSDYPVAPLSIRSSRVSPLMTQLFGFVTTRTLAPTYISQTQLNAIPASQQLELVLIIEDGDSVAVQGALPVASSPTANTSPASPAPSATPTPTPTPTPAPTLTPKPTPAPSKPPAATVKPTPEPKATALPTATPSSTPTPTPTPEPVPTEQQVAVEPSAQEPVAIFEAVEIAVVETVEAIADVLNLDLPIPGEPVANPAIGATGDDSVIVEFDPLGTPEAVKATNNLLAATGALIGVAAAAGAAAAAAAAAGAASAAGSAASAAASSVNSSAAMNEDALDALAGAEYEIDVFEDEKARWGDMLAIFAIPLINFLDKPTRHWTRRVARFSPFVAKLLNDGVYLRAILGSASLLPAIAAIAFAITALFANQGALLHPPVGLFIALTVLGIFDAFAGSLGVLVFVLGSLPLVRLGEITDWRMLAGIVVAGFGPIILARSIRNFRRKAPSNLAGWLDRLGDLAFASLMGGWVAGLIVRALPALTGLTLPAANYVATFQFVATIAIALRILVEEYAARYYPARMDSLAPDWLPEPPKVQVITAQVLRYFFYVFIASAFMGFGPLVWIAAVLFMAPTIAGHFTARLPRLPWLTRWMPVGLPGLAMVLGLEIYLENTLSAMLGDHPDFSIIFVYSLLLLILFISLLGLLARPEENEDHWLKNAKYRWIYRLGGLVTLLLLMQFTSML